MKNKTLELFNKIISEESENINQNKDKNNVIDGDAKTPKIIEEDDIFNEDEDKDEKAKVDENKDKIETTEETDTDIDTNSNNDKKNDDKSSNKLTIENADANETEFIENLLKATELQAVNIAIKSFIEDVKSKLGTNSELCVNIAQNKLKEVETEFKDVIKKIKENRENIMKEAEQAKNKENLISIFDKAVDISEDDIQDDKNIIIDNSK